MFALRTGSAVYEHTAFRRTPDRLLHELRFFLVITASLNLEVQIATIESVNVTIGLPIVRTSPDHGTAYDIAGKGLARPISMQRALKLAIEMVERRANAV